jgi:hypothetical protein
MRSPRVGGYVQTYAVPHGTREVWVPAGHTWSPERGVEAPRVDPETAYRRMIRAPFTEWLGSLPSGPLSIVFLPVWVALFLVAGPVLILAACLSPSAADELRS